MANVILPPRPAALGDDDPLRRVHFRLWQIVITAGTIFLTGWFFTLGAVPGIIAVLFAKHILVAVLAVGLQLPPPKKPEPPKPGE
jgi:hypothetical protein